MKIEGKCVYINSNGERRSIKGHGSLSENTGLQDLQISGKIFFEKISCDKIKIKGDGRGKSINAKNISVSGSLEVDLVSVEKIFEISGKAKIENLVAGDISMDSCSGAVDSIKCDKIKIFHSDEPYNEGIFSKLFGSKTNQKKLSRVRIKNISAEKVELKNCEVEEIKCKDAFIDSNCVIKKLIVSGECEIVSDSKVGETVRN